MTEGEDDKGEGAGREEEDDTTMTHGEERSGR